MTETAKNKTASKPYCLRRRRESITADEVLEAIARSNRGDAYTAEKTFAMGLIELAIGHIVDNGHG